VFSYRVVESRGGVYFTLFLAEVSKDASNLKFNPPLEAPAHTNPSGPRVLFKSRVSRILLPFYFLAGPGNVSNFKTTHPLSSDAGACVVTVETVAIVTSNG